MDGHAQQHAPDLEHFDLSGLKPPGQPPLIDDPQFQTFYSNYESEFLKLVANEEYEQVEGLWERTWRASASFISILSSEDGTKFCHVHDFHLYERALNLLFPDVLQTLSEVLTKQIRDFSKRATKWMVDALHGLPEPFVEQKLHDVQIFAQRVKRWTSLCHLIKGAKKVIGIGNKIALMHDEYVKIDFGAVVEQFMAMAPNCTKGTVLKFEERFRQLLTPEHAILDWALWMQEVVSAILTPHAGTERLSAVAAEVYVNWSLLGSLVMRDLTLRSAETFGLCHLLRLLCDEYVLYLVEHAVVAGSCDSLPVHSQQQLPERKVRTPRWSVKSLRSFLSSSPLPQSATRSLFHDCSQLFIILHICALLFSSLLFSSLLFLLVIFCLLFFWLGTHAVFLTHVLLLFLTSIIALLHVTWSEGSSGAGESAQETQGRKSWCSPCITQSHYHGYTFVGNGTLDSPCPSFTFSPLAGEGYLPHPSPTLQLADLTAISVVHHACDVQHVASQLLLISSVMLRAAYSS